VPETGTAVADYLIGLANIDKLVSRTMACFSLGQYTKDQKMKLSDLKIGTRLYGGFGMVVLLLVVLVSIAYVNLEKAGAADDLNIHTHEVIEEINGIAESLANIETGQRGFALTGNEAFLAPYTAGKEAFKKHMATATSLTANNPQQQDRLKDLDAEQGKWLSAAIDPVIALRRDVVQGKGTIVDVNAFVTQGKGKQGMDAMRALLAQIKDSEKGLLEQRGKEANALQVQTEYTLIIGGAIAALLSMMLAVWLARNVTAPLGVAVDLAKRVALGDLTAKVEARSKDETGQLMGALKDMNDALVRIVGEVRNGTETIATASGQIASGNMDLSSRTEQQASSLEETASSMEELTSTVKQNADNARQANTLAVSASEVASKGGAVVAQVVDTMGSINESAKKIVDIIGVIDGIAFQTNILALNAAVEAARAGEQGRGFAVVASEVRNLAQRSAAAAKEIKTLIGDSVEKVEVGAKLVDQAGTTMEEIVQSVRRVTDIIGEISAASDEQRAGIEQVNQAISQMDQVTQQNASLVEEAAAAAESMQEQSKNLAQVVSVFKLDGMQAAALAPARREPGLPPPGKARARVGMQPAQRSKSGSALAAPRPRRPAVEPATGDDWEQF
jgi:methyl-accepting chemotaxis protein